MPPSRDDGRIHVCVRVRDVPSYASLPPQQAEAGSATPRQKRTSFTAGTPNGQAAAAAASQDPTSICVSTLDNVVVMHDPRTLHDASSIARDASALIQSLKAREDGSTAGLEPLATARYQNHTQSSATATGGTAGGNGASYFECDECIVSMDPANSRLMPIVRDSDFLQPPAYGKQEDVYQGTAAQAVEASLEGINSCVFAYGQTGSGKTYTLFGDTSCLTRDPGVVLRSIDDLFRQLEARKAEADSDADLQIEYKYDVKLSFFEIYQSDVTCLLSRRGPLKVTVSDGPPVIHELDVRSVSSYAQAVSFIEVGLRRRQTGETGMNAKSSRSHAIVQITLRQYRTNKRTKETVEFCSVINMVDLAGSERQRTAKTEGKSRNEGIQINQSLTALARVINEISKGAKFVNYRDSMLTLILRENLGGNSKTFMIATISPIVHAFHESCATLQYAKHVRMIRNKPKVNKTYQTRGHLQEIITQLKEENDQLKAQIEGLIHNRGGCAEDSDATGSETPLLLQEPPPPPTGHFGRLDTMCHLEEMLNGKGGTAPVNQTVPLLVTSKRVTTTSGAVPYTRCDGRVHITPMDRSSLEWDMAPFFSTPLSSPCTLVVEAITQRSMETTYWAQTIFPTSLPAATTLTVELNGRLIESDDSLPLAHGDVVAFTMDNAASGEQEVLSMHFVDLNTFGGRAPQPQGKAAVRETSSAIPEHAKDHRIAQLEKEVTKLLDVVGQQSRTIEYQCQRQNAMSFRSGNNTAQPSRATSAAQPLSERLSVATVASPDISRQLGGALPSYTEDVPSLEATALLASFNAAARPSTSTSRTELGSLSPPSAANSRPMTALNASRATSAARGDEGSRYDAALEENRRLQLQLAECQDTILTLEMDNGALLYRIERMEDTNDDGGQTTPRMARTPRCPLPTAGDSPMRQSLRRPGSELSAAELRERLLSSKRERALKEDIVRLEGTIEDLHQQIRSIERMMEDASAEHSIELHEAQSEAAELSRALLSTSAEYDNVVAQLESLQLLARRAEDAVTEVSVSAEVELERRLNLLSAEKHALMTLCKLWKYRAVQTEVKLLVLTSEDRQSIAAMSKVHTEEALRRSVRNGTSLRDAEEANVSALLESVEKDCDAELVDILKTNVRDLEREKLELKDKVHTLASSLESHRIHMADLEEEKSRLEREKHNGDDHVRSRTQQALRKKSEELAAAENLRRELSEKLQTALTTKNRLHQRVKSANEMLRDENRKHVQKLEEQVAQLTLTVAEQAEELQQLNKIQGFGSSIGEGDQFADARAQLETALETAVAEHIASTAQLASNHPASLFARTASVYSNLSAFSDQYNAFPKTFVFSDGVVGSIRMCLRILMDRLKVELYVMNKATAQTISSILPTVQFRPDTVFQSCMTDARRVVASVTKCALKIGCKWTNGSECPETIVRQIPEADRRVMHRALVGLLLWYDHWSVVNKRDNGSYVELVRNAEVLLALAKQARQETRTPTNALPFETTHDSTSRVTTAAPTSNRLPETDDPVVREGRKVLALLQKSHRESILVKQLKSPVEPKPAIAAAAVEAERSTSPEATPPPSSKIRVPPISPPTLQNISPHGATSRHHVDVEEGRKGMGAIPLSGSEVDAAAKFMRQSKTDTNPGHMEMKKRLSRMSEDEIVSMVLKDKKKIFPATAKTMTETAKRVSRRDAVLSFFRTTSPPKSKIMSTLPINSPQGTEGAPRAKEAAPCPPKLNLTRLK